MWSMKFIGQPFIWQFQRLPGDVGILNRGCVADTPAGHVVLTQGDVVIHQGQGTQSIINAKLRKWLFANIDATNYKRAFVATNPGAFAARRKAVFAPGAPASPQSTGAGAALSDDHTTEGNVMPQADTNAVTRESFERDHPALFAALRSEFMAAGAAAEADLADVHARPAANLHATILHAVGIDPTRTLRSPIGRTFPRSEGTPIAALAGV